MKTWILRLALLCAIPLAAAFVDAAFVRPMPKAAPKPAVTTPGETATTPGETATASVVDGAITLAKAIEAYDGGEAFFLDARPHGQYLEERISGSLHLDVESFRQGRPALLDLLSPDQQLVIYCGGGDCDASKMVKRMLESNGYTNLSIFEEGFPAWKGAGLPIETGEPATP